MTNLDADKLPERSPLLKERGNDYGGGTWRSMAEKIARKWSATTGHHIHPRHVAIMMIDLKTVRESVKHKGDNLDDINGYSDLQKELENEL